VRNPLAPTPAAVKDGQLDPEELKDALLQQALAQRRALVSKSLRKGTGRDVKRPKYELSVVVPSPVRMQPELQPTSTQNADGAFSPFHFGPAKDLQSPMEGVPERLDPTRDQGITTDQARPQATDKALSPMEGVPEFGVLPDRPKLRSNSDVLMPPPPPVAAVPESDFEFGYDDFGDGGGYDDFGGGGDYDEAPATSPSWINQPLPGRESAQLIAPKRKRIVLNPGIRLRNELDRKSLAMDANVGLQEVAPGLRRSTRRAQEPLKWWLGEKKQFNRRKYKAMPTVASVMVDPDPASPWKTVSDPTGARQDKYKVSKPAKKGPKKGVQKKMVTRRARTPEKVPEENGNATEDEDTLLINQNTPVRQSVDPSAMSDVTLPLGHGVDGHVTPTSKKSMGTIPEADGSSASMDESSEDILAGEDDEIIIMGRSEVEGSLNVASQTGGDEPTFNPPLAEPSTATVDQTNNDGEGEVNKENSKNLDNDESSERNGSAKEIRKSSPSKEPTRRSARNRKANIYS